MCVGNVRLLNVAFLTVNKCPAPDTPDKGIVQYDSVEYKSTATYSCSKPYTLLGNKYRKCLVNETWSGRVPSCQGIWANYCIACSDLVSLVTVLNPSFILLLVVKCEPPEFLLYGFIDVGHGPIVTGYQIHYRCQAGGFLGGESSSTCLDDGSWSTDLPECKGGAFLPSIFVNTLLLYMFWCPLWHMRHFILRSCFWKTKSTFMYFQWRALHQGLRMEMCIKEMKWLYDLYYMPK